MTDPLRRQTAIFVIRVWTEYLKECPPIWRGELEQAMGGQKSLFNNQEEMLELIRKHTLGQVQTEGKT